MATTPLTRQQLIDGATDLDTIEAIANSSELTYESRTGGTVKTMAGIRASTKYDVPVAFATSISVTTETQTVTYLGVIYAPDPSELPFTTTGSFDSSQWYPIQDPRGYVHEDTIAAMSATAVAAVSAGDIIIVKARATAGDGGGGTFRVTKADISTEVTADSEGGVYVPFDASPGDGSNGGFIREYYGSEVSSAWFGTVGDGVTDDTAALQGGIDYLNSIYPGGSNGGNGGTLLIPAGSYLYTGLIVKKGVNIKGAGMIKTVMYLDGATSTGWATPAKASQAAVDIVTFGEMSDLSLVSNETSPSTQIQIDMTGFTRFSWRNCLINFFGGCNGMEMLDATLAGSGGPSQWYNMIDHCFFVKGASQASGGIALNLGDTAGTKEQVTALTMSGGRITGAGTTSSGVELRGTGCHFFGVALEGLTTAITFGGTGTRGGTANSVIGCYFESNTTHRRIHANGINNTFVGNFLTGGSDNIDSSNKTNTFLEPGYNKVYGDLEFNVAGEGPSFEAVSVTAGGTPTSHTLDDYKENTWTPVLAGSTTPGTYTTSGTATYTKVGRLIHAFADLTFSAASGGSGNLEISGLPENYLTGKRLGGSVAANLVNFGATAPFGLSILGKTTGAGNTFYIVETNDNGAWSFLQAGGITTSSTLRIMVIYEA